MAAQTYQRPAHSMRALRRLGMQLFRQGAARGDVMRELGVSRTTAYNWAAAREHDDAPSDMPAPALAGIDAARLQMVANGGALAYGFPTDHWTIARLAIMIEWEFDMVWSTLQVFRMLGPVLPKPGPAQHHARRPD